jgi:anti-anti-sigma factor
MKRHRMMATTVVPGSEGGGADTVANQTQTASGGQTPSGRPVRARSLASDGGFVPTSVTTRVHTLILTGELDRGSAYAFEAEIERLCEEGVTSITLDLRELTYIDPIGVAVIAFRCRLCQRRGYGFELIPGSRMIQRAFEQAGVAGQLPFKQDDADEAQDETGAAGAGAHAGAALTTALSAGGDL